jgi:hypothetical protein
MPTFDYRTTTSDGVELAGKIDAPSREQAIDQLRRKGMTIVALTAAAEPSSLPAVPPPAPGRTATTRGAGAPAAVPVQLPFRALAIRVLAALVIIFAFFGIGLGLVSQSGALVQSAAILFLIGCVVFSCGDWMASVDRRLHEIQLNSRQREAGRP